MLFGSSGIRRKYDASLVELAVSVGSSVAADAKTVTVGRDARTTGTLLARAFIAGVLSSGGNVQYGDVIPTPTVALGTRSANAGCMITASHNPEQYNGMKLINPDGSAFTLEQQNNIERLVEQKHWTEWAEQGAVKNVDLITPHIETILDKIEPDKEMTMVVDCGNGAGSVITPSLLTRAGVATKCLNCNISGKFARPSEPLEANLPYVGSMVRSLNAGGAIIHDGDADRFMAFDRKGRYINGDHLLMLFSMYLGAEKVVTTVDASMAIEEVAEVRRTPVGDSFVSEKLLSWGEFGGEPSGSWIFPDHSLCPDGIYAAALFCKISSEWDVAEVLDDLPRYPILRSSVFCDNAREVIRALGAENPTDGIRIEEEDGWCLVRASGTEPKIRVTAEGKTRKFAEEMSEMGHGLLKKAITN